MDTKTKCNRCKVELPSSDFKQKRNGELMKRCIQCNAVAAANKAKNKCSHGRQRSQCKDCGGGEICEHDRRRSRCKDCGGASICEHGKHKQQCRDCGGSQICEHGRQRSQCKDCGGASICEHGKHKSICKDCGGGSVCEHGRQKRQCKQCDPPGHLASVVSCRVRNALRSAKSKRSIEYLGCDIETFREHIEAQFEEGMCWDNYGEWEIDHVVPLKYQTPTLEEVMERLHYTNTQPLWMEDNIAKGNRRIGK